MAKLLISSSDLEGGHCLLSTRLLTDTAVYIQLVILAVNNKNFNSDSLLHLDYLPPNKEAC